MSQAVSWTSRATWDLLTRQQQLRSAGLARRQLDERVVTDTALTAVERLSGGRLQVVLFSQSDEAATGGDVEILVVDAATRRYVQLLVQAKMMSWSRSGEAGRGGVCSVTTIRRSTRCTRALVLMRTRRERGAPR